MASKESMSYKEGVEREKSLPKLQPPGAGLPRIQLWAARYWLFPKWVRQSSWERAHEHLKREEDKIRALLEGFGAVLGTRKVLIEPLKGLEDSSRYWSINETLEHLHITNTGFARIIVLLSKGEAPKSKSSTAAVKPKSLFATFSEARSAYEASCREYRRALADDCKERDSKTKYEHPWLGPLTAFEWHVLTGYHQGIHRRQIAAILAGLKLEMPGRNPG